MFDNSNLIIYNFSMNLVPKFIVNNYTKGKLSGRMDSVILSIDLVGFTKLTDKLAKSGKASVEELSDIINNVFGKSIEIIYKNYGWISSYNGDGFIAVFPTERCLNAIRSAKEISDKINNLKIKTRYGKFIISIRAGLSEGKVNWGIVKTTHGNYYYFYGKSFKDAVKSQKNSKPGQVILGKNIPNICGDDIKIKKFNNLYGLVSINGSIPTDKKKKKIEIRGTKIERFIPTSLKGIENGGEFRFITSVFLFFKSHKKKEEIEQFVVKVLELVTKYKGFLNKIDFADKGNVMLILFGAPLALENPAINAMEFADRMRIQFGENIKIGATEGVAYTGIVGNEKRCEYTAIGEIVNLSSRIGEKADWGGVNVSERIFNSTKNRFDYVYLGGRKFKGINRNIKIYDLKEKRSLTERIYPGEIIGRSREILKIITIINEANEKGEGKIINVEGAAGIGKSRLLMEVKKKISPEDFYWAYLPCDNILRESLNPLSYFIKKHFMVEEIGNSGELKENFDNVYNDILRNIKDNRLKKELINYYSYLANFAGIDVEDDLFFETDPKEIYKKTLHSLLVYFKALSSLKTVIMEFEDIHWVDDDTVNFLELLVENIKDFPIVLIMIGRSVEKEQLKKIYKKSIDRKSIKLKPLSKRACKELITAGIGAPASNEVVEFIWNKGEGNPFYMEQIALFLLEKGFLDMKNGRYVLKKRDFDVPASISNIVMSRIDKLEANLKNAVKNASVLGMQFSIRVLSAMLKNKIDLFDIKNIESKDIWKIINEMFGIFKHALIRDTVYNMQLKKTLKKLHKTAAEAIENVFPEDINSHVSELAYHYYEAEEYDKAKKYMYIAAQRAWEEYRNSNALEMYEKLLYIEHDKRKVLDIKLRISEIFHRTGKWNQVIELTKKILKSAKETGYKFAMAKGYKLLALVYEGTERVDESEKLAKEAMKLFKEIGNNTAYSDMLSIVATIYYHRAEYEKAIKLFNEKLKLDKKTGYKKGYYSALSRLGLIYFDFGKFNMALKMFKENLEFAEKSGKLDTMSHMWGNIGLIYWREKEYGKAIANFQKVLKVARQLGDVQSEAEASNNLGIVYQEMGDFDNAIKYLKYGYKLCKEIGDKVTLGYTTGNLGLVYLGRGEFDKAISNFNITKEIATATNDPLSKAIAFLSIGETYMLKGIYDRAKREIKKSIDLFSKMKMYYMLSKAYYENAEISYLLGKEKQSQTLLAKTYKILQKSPRNDIKIKCEILENKLLKNKEKAVKNLEKLLNKTDKKEEIADIYYAIFSISKDIKIARKTLNMYKSLYKDTPLFVFKMRINEIESFLNGVKNS